MGFPLRYDRLATLFLAHPLMRAQGTASGKFDPDVRCFGSLTRIPSISDQRIRRTRMQMEAAEN
jgi:hypothetical protein